MFLAQGASWLALKAPKPSEVQTRAAGLRLPFQVVSLVLFAVVSVYALVGIQAPMDPALGVVRWLLAALFVVAVVASVFFAKKKDCDLGAFVAQSASCALLVLLLAASMFPNFVMASADSVGPAITAMSAASSDLTLRARTRAPGRHGACEARRVSRARGAAERSAAPLAFSAGFRMLPNRQGDGERKGL